MTQDPDARATVATRGATLYDIDAVHTGGGVIRVKSITPASLANFTRWMESEGYTVAVTSRELPGPRYVVLEDDAA